VDSAPLEHPNAPRRAHLALAFMGIVFAGLLGGAIGYGIVDTTCHEEPTTADALLSIVPGYEVTTESCDAVLVGGALVGGMLAAVGAGIIAMLVLRAHSEWKAHPPEPGAYRSQPNTMRRKPSA